MSERLINGGAESGSAPWNLSGLAAVAGPPLAIPYAGSFCWRLRKTGTFFDIQTGAMQQDFVPLTPGASHDVATWIDSTNRGGSVLVCEVDRGDGQLVELAREEQTASGWRVWSVGSFVALGPLGSLRFSTATTGPNTPAGLYLLDEVSLLGPEPEDSVAKMTWPVVDALRRLFLQLDGTGGYATNLGGRVVPGLILPGERAELQSAAYACIAFGREEAVVKPLGPAGDQLDWKIRVFVYLPRTKPWPDFQLTRDVANARDDVMALLKTNPSLDNTVRNLAVLPINSDADIEPGRSHGEVAVVLQAMNICQRSTLLG